MSRLPALVLPLAVSLFGGANVAAADPSLTLSVEQQRLLGVSTVPARAAEALLIEGLVGEVQLPLAGTVAVATPYAGRVLAVEVDEGDTVTAGQAVATIASHDYADDLAALARRRAELEVARRVEARDDELLAAGVIPAARAEASRAARAVAVAELAALETTIGRVRAAPDAQAAFLLTAPRAGRIVARHVALGESLAALAVALVIAGDDGWRLEAQVPSALAAGLGEGASLHLDGLTMPVAGRALSLDDATQTVRVRAGLPAGSGYAPGQRVEVTLARPAPAGALAVPRGALSRVAEQARVFVARGERFEWLAVEVLGESGAESVIAAPFAAGTPVVVGGVAALKAQIGD